jgi:hypothetical protein
MKLWNVKQPSSGSGLAHLIALTFEGAFVIGVLFTALLYLPALTWGFGHDQNVFAEIGSLLLKGKLPYIDAWDIKPPNIYYLYALAEGIIGRTEFAIRLADYLSTIGTAIILFFYVARCSPARDGDHNHLIIAPMLFAWIALSLGLADTAQTESFSLPFIAGAMLAWTYKDQARFALLTGILIGIAGFFKTTNFLFAIPFIVQALFRFKHAQVRKALLMCIGGVVLASAVEIFFMAWQGFLGEYFVILESVLELHGGEQSGSPVTIWGALRIVYLYSGTFSIVAVLGLFFLYKPKKGLSIEPEMQYEKRGALFSLAMVATGIVAVLVQRKGWGYHYVILLPGLVAFVTIGSNACFRRLEKALSTHTESWARFVTGMVIVPMIVLMPHSLMKMEAFETGFKSLSNHEAYLKTLGSAQSIYYPPCTLTLGDYLKQHTSEKDQIFILGQEPGAYWHADRTPASRYIYTLLFTSPMMTDARFAELNQSLSANPPKLIVVERFDTLAFSGVPMTSEMLLHTSKLQGLDNLLASEYVLSDTVCEKFFIYKRKS